MLLLQVCAVTRGGAFAEEVCLNEGGVLKLPPGVDVVSAAGVSETYSVSISAFILTYPKRQKHLTCYCLKHELKTH